MTTIKIVGRALFGFAEIELSDKERAYWDSAIAGNRRSVNDRWVNLQGTHALISHKNKNKTHTVIGFCG
jgi:hypothetical protein